MQSRGLPQWHSLLGALQSRAQRSRGQGEMGVPSELGRALRTAGLRTGRTWVAVALIGGGGPRGERP